ncbi:MAG: hypothetical protein CMH62_03465 [Nanoarchaeota archaeon]|nr:hypothetical protein [Nanoarchaeota archaeon]
MLDIETKQITIFLLVIVSLLGIANLNKDLVGLSVLGIALEDKNFEIEDNVINLNSLTLRQKIGQMIFTLAKIENRDLLQEMNIGGIYFWQKENEDVYETEIDYFQKEMEIPFFVGIDLEGCWNPFDNFEKFPAFNEIKDESDAYTVGKNHGEILKKLGFNINFSPVVDQEDTIWGCRSFSNNVAGNAVYYIRGLQGQGIIATAKHYPGKTLIGRDPHKSVEFSVIEDEDLEPFKWAANNNVGAVMVSHLVTSGKVDSGFSPSVVSGNVINGLKKDFDGLVLSDEVGMNGLKGVYSRDERAMYIDLVNAGNDVILDFRIEPWHLFKVVSIIENAVETGEISEERIDDAVIKILKAKGFKVKRKV